MPASIRNSLIFLFLLVWIFPAAAQDSMYEGDARRKMKEDIEDVFGLYILNPSRRHADEKVKIKKLRSGKETVELSIYFDQRRPSKDRVKCYVYRWLLLGRFGDGGGTRTLFSRYPNVQNADLVFYTLVSDLSVDSKGKYTVRKLPRTFLRARVTRARAARLNWKELEKTLARDGAKCAKTGEKAVDQWKYGSYLGKR